MSAHVDRSDWSAWEHARASLTFAGFVEEVARGKVALGFGGDGEMQMLMPADRYHLPPERLGTAFDIHAPTLHAFCEAFYDVAPRRIPDYGLRPLTELERIAHEIAHRGVVFRIEYEYEVGKPQYQIVFAAVFGAKDRAEMETLSLAIRRNQGVIEKLFFSFEEYQYAVERGVEIVG
jgi:hypothetical protein